MFDVVTEACSTTSNTHIQLLIEKYNDTIMQEGERYCDADFIEDPDDRKSTIGYRIIYLAS
ncbi:hypothetical protein RJ640_007788 [Escallonia rubra]|uniref:Uncharacterized protein n=1 Tax=Escallonia rubra TaxID=112253 RepID=A0AA88RRJ3_9ASTE|nr:hypothetical protein RJ640_007788 [Escallonia rubra]